MLYTTIALTANLAIIKRPSMGKVDQYKMDNAPGYLIYLSAMRNRLVLKKTYQKAGYNLAPEQVGLLSRLYEEEGVTQKQLAERTFKDKPSTTRIIDQLEKKGFVIRKDHPSDRRAACLFLTPKGHKARAALVKAMIELGKRVYRNFSASEKNKFIQLIQKFYQNLGREL